MGYSWYISNSVAIQNYGRWPSYTIGYGNFRSGYSRGTSCHRYGQRRGTIRFSSCSYSYVREPSTCRYDITICDRACASTWGRRRTEEDFEDDLPVVDLYEGLPDGVVFPPDDPARVYLNDSDYKAPDAVDSSDEPSNEIYDDKYVEDGDPAGEGFNTQDDGALEVVIGDEHWHEEDGTDEDSFEEIIDGDEFVDRNVTLDFTDQDDDDPANVGDGN